MNFDKFNPEKNLLKQEQKSQDSQEQECNIEKLTAFIKEISQEIKKERVSVTDDCRIDMSFFKGIYPPEEIKKDEDFVKKCEFDWYKNSLPKQIKKEKLKTSGEKLEMLKTAIFNKFLGKDFIALRTSSYDDIKNKIDNIVLEKETGNIVCALDEVAETMDTRYQEKAERVLLRNKKEEGGKLKYGVKIEKDENNQSKLFLGKIKNIPLFYLALPERHINGGIKELIPSFEKVSDYEKKLFSYFLSVFEHQMNYLKLERNLTPELKKRIENFERVIEKFKK